MAFEKVVPEWGAAGSEPPASLKSGGFTAGYKPPAQYFNWFFNRVSEALEELQTKTVEKGNILNKDFNTVTASGIYRFNTPSANGPGFQYGQLLVLHGEGDTIAQLAFSYEGDVLVRAGNPTAVGGTGTWSQWHKIYNSKNTVPISNGGTGATTAAGALSALGAAAAEHRGRHNRLSGADPVKLSDVAYLGSNPISIITADDDTVASWCNLGSGYAYYGATGDYGLQPSRYGQLVSYVAGSDVFQIWRSLPAGPTFWRSGSGSSWASGWVKIYDENNPPPLTLSRLVFQSVTVNNFAADTTYADFPFRAAVTLAGALSSMRPEVVFGVVDAMSGVFAPVAESYDGGIYIYASEKPEAAITIPTIVLWR